MSGKISNRIEVFDGWRGSAILLVLIGHFTFSDWVWEERMGVDVFFVLSGVLMAKILFVERMNLKDFYVRRISRVIPALIVFLLVATALSIYLGYDFSTTEIGASLFFLRTYFPSSPEYFTTATPTGHLWSLSVEEHSYLILSLMSVVLLARKKIAYALIGIYVLSVAINLSNMFSMTAQQFEYSLIRTESAIGFIAFSAGYSLLKRDKGWKASKHMPWVFMLIAFSCYLDAAPIWLTFTLCPVLLGIAINHLTESASLFQAVLKNPVIRFLGVTSYSIYLWQQVFYKLHYALPFGQILGFFASIAVGVASFYLLENPARRYLNNRWSPNPGYRTHSLPSNDSASNDSIKLKSSESQNVRYNNGVDQKPAQPRKSRDKA